ncbi:unnamed protein product [Arctogadus glacialis]
MCLCEMYYHDIYIYIYIYIYNVCAYYRNKDNIFELLSMGRACDTMVVRTKRGKATSSGSVHSVVVHYKKKKKIIPNLL